MSKYYLIANKNEVDFVSTYFKFTSTEHTHKSLVGYTNYLYINTDTMTYTFEELLGFNEMAEHKLINIKDLRYIARDIKIDKILEDV